MFESLITTGNPITGSQMRAMGKVPQTYRGQNAGGSQSRDAYSRAMADMGRNQVMGAADKATAEYRQRAEQARSADLMAQRQVDQGRYALGKEKEQITRQQDTKYREGRKQLKQYRSLARLRAEQQLANNAIGAIIGTGLTAALAPTIGPALAGGAGLTGAFGLTGAGGAGSGLFSGLLSNGAVSSLMRPAAAPGIAPLPTIPRGYGF